MLIIAIAWIYVVAMMAITEGSIVAGILTFVLYCVIPLSLVLYLQRSKMRQARQAHLQRLRARQALDPDLAASSGNLPENAPPTRSDQENKPEQ